MGACSEATNLFPFAKKRNDSCLKINTNCLSFSRDEHCRRIPFIRRKKRERVWDAFTFTVYNALQKFAREKPRRDDRVLIDMLHEKRYSRTEYKPRHCGRN